MSGSRVLTVSDVERKLTELTPQFAPVLPPGMTPERFGRVALTAIQNAPNLLKCEPGSLWNACMKAAQDGLLPDGREGAIIPRAGQAVWSPMVQGLIAKAKRRGSVTNLVANIVYEGEPFEVLMGDEDRILHRRELNRVQKGNEVAVYAIATLKDGTKEREVMTWEEVQAVRRMSTTPNAGPWVTSEGEMARKTCIRRLSKRLPALDDDDDDLRQAIERVDELYPFGKNAPQKPAPIIEHAAPPARPGGMVEVAREMANGDAPTGQTLKQVVARLVVDFAQAQSAGGLADIEAREETKKILARGPDSDAAKAVVKARDAARERLLTLPTEDEGDARLEHKMMET